MKFMRMLALVKTGGQVGRGPSPVGGAASSRVGVACQRRALGALVAVLVAAVLVPAAAISTASAQGTTPGKPGMPELVGATKTSLVVKWLPPTSFGSGLDRTQGNQGWDVRVCMWGIVCDQTGTSNWWNLSQTDVTGPDSDGYYSVSISNGNSSHFSANSLHLVKVRAYSSAGAGEFSDRLGSDSTGGTISTLAYGWPVFSADRETEIYVYDYLSGGTAFWIPLTATDSSTPAETVTYRLAGTDADSFSIDGDTGQLSLASGVSLDADIKDTYSIFVLASDDGDFSNNHISGNTQDNDNAALVVTVGVRSCESGGGIWCARMMAEGWTTGPLSRTGYKVDTVGKLLPSSEFVSGGVTLAVDHLLEYPAAGNQPVALAFGYFDDPTLLYGHYLKIGDYLFELDANSYTDVHREWRWASHGLGIHDNLSDPNVDNHYEVAIVRAAPVFDPGSVSIHVYDYTSGGSDFWSPLTAVHPDPDETLSYSLGGTDAGFFSIDSATGQLSLRSSTSLDAAVRNSYSFKVIASDSAATTASLDVTVEVRKCDGGSGIWCATMMAEELVVDGTGFGTGYQVDAAGKLLPSSEFVIGGVTADVYYLLNVPPAIPPAEVLSPETLIFSVLDPGSFDYTLSYGYYLKIGDDLFEFSQASYNAESAVWSWADPGLSIHDNRNNANVDQDYQVAIVPAPPMVLGSSVADQSYVVGRQITRLTLPEVVSGGTAPFTYALVPSPPSGLAFDASARTLSGTPDISQEGREYCYEVTDSVAITEQMCFDIEVGPARPADLQARGGDRQVTVSWSDPMDAGVSGYDVRYCPTASDCDYKQGNENHVGADWTDAGHVGTGTSVTIAGLQTGVEYGVNVRARYSGGAGSWSESAIATTTSPLPPGPPEAPSAPAVSGLSTSSLSVSWAAPASGGSAVTGYEVVYREWGTQDWLDVDHVGTSTSATITGLTGMRADGSVYDKAGVIFEVRVRASNSLGDGEWSDAGFGMTLDDKDSDSVPGAPAIPAAPSVSGLSKSSLSVVWAPASGGSAVTDYDVRYRAGGDYEWVDVDGDGTLDLVENWSEHPHSGTATSATIGGLLTGANYLVQVRATNAEGSSGWSLSGAGTTVDDKPDAVPETPGAGTPGTGTPGTGTPGTGTGGSGGAPSQDSGLGVCPTAAAPFVDVDRPSSAAAAIDCVYGLGITKGTSADTYSPAESVTRAQMALFLSRLWAVMGRPCPTAAAPFEDVDRSSSAAAAIDCVYGLGITMGTSADTYSPSEPVTRAQMALFLSRLWQKL